MKTRRLIQIQSRINWGNIARISSKHQFASGVVDGQQVEAEQVQLGKTDRKPSIGYEYQMRYWKRVEERAAQGDPRALEVIERRRAYQAAWQRQYNQRLEVKERLRAYEQRPEVRPYRAAYWHEYHQRLEVKERERTRRQSPERRAYQAAYHQRPEVKARKAAYKREYAKRKRRERVREAPQI